MLRPLLFPISEFDQIYESASKGSNSTARLLESAEKIPIKTEVLIVAKGIKG
ncbi:hypothetical protein UF75_3366 [Desulfosporosinus sp. I2]|nr:hypothetical protein UF75_3366 [Desulfosporosinus sp. I2]